MLRDPGGRYRLSELSADAFAIFRGEGRVDLIEAVFELVVDHKGVAELVERGPLFGSNGEAAVVQNGCRMTLAVDDDADGVPPEFLTDLLKAFTECA